MLKIYYKIGGVFYRLRYLFYLLLLGAVVATGMVMFGDAQTSERYLLPLLVLCTWLVLCLTFGYHTASPMPEKDPDAGAGERFMINMKRGFSYLLALLIIVSSLGLLWASSTALRILLQT